jgi:hypothetical protein
VQVDVDPSRWWRRLVFPKERPEGTADKAAYVFCVLEQLHQRLKAATSSRSLSAGATRGPGCSTARPG